MLEYETEVIMKKMSLKDFIYMFIALCFPHHDYIDKDIFTNYLCDAFNLNYNDINVDLEDIFNEMQNNGYIQFRNTFNYLITINSNFPYQEIITNKKEYIKDISIYVDDYNHYVFSQKKMSK